MRIYGVCVVFMDKLCVFIIIPLHSLNESVRAGWVDFYHISVRVCCVYVCMCEWSVCVCGVRMVVVVVGAGGGVESRDVLVRMVGRTSCERSACVCVCVYAMSSCVDMIKHALYTNNYI